MPAPAGCGQQSTAHRPKRRIGCSILQVVVIASEFGDRISGDDSRHRPDAPRTQPIRIVIAGGIIPIELIQVDPAGDANRVFLGPAAGLLIDPQMTRMQIDNADGWRIDAASASSAVIRVICGLMPPATPIGSSCVQRPVS